MEAASGVLIEIQDAIGISKQGPITCFLHELLKPNEAEEKYVLYPTTGNTECICGCCQNAWDVRINITTNGDTTDEPLSCFIHNCFVTSRKGDVVLEYQVNSYRYHYLDNAATFDCICGECTEEMWHGLNWDASFVPESA